METKKRLNKPITKVFFYTILGGSMIGMIALSDYFFNRLDSEFNTKREIIKTKILELKGSSEKRLGALEYKINNSFYKVERGDNLSKIAGKYGCKTPIQIFDFINEVQEVNQFLCFGDRLKVVNKKLVQGKDNLGDLIYPGQFIFIPNKYR